MRKYIPEAPIGRFIRDKASRGNGDACAEGRSVISGSLPFNEEGQGYFTPHMYERDQSGIRMPPRLRPRLRRQHEGTKNGDASLSREDYGQHRTNLLRNEASLDTRHARMQ